MVRKRFLFIAILFGYGILLNAQIKIASWNLCNFGKSKSDEEIAFIANTVKNIDILAIQEVSESYYGPQAVAKLAEELNRKGSKWDYAISEATNGKGRERYAFIWKTSKISLKEKPTLAKSLDEAIDREPFVAKFKTNEKFEFAIATFHAVPKSKEPWRECKHLHKLSEIFPKENLMLMGDFNLSEKHLSFDKLKKTGLIPALVNVKTSIKMEQRGNEKFANEYDNVFYDSAKFKILKSGILDFTDKFPNLKEARKISDHVPVYVEVEQK